MKKILSILLAIAMILSLSVPAFAENETNTDGGNDSSQTVTTAGENSQNVTADYTPSPISTDVEAKWGASATNLNSGSGTLEEAFEAAKNDATIQYIQLQKNITTDFNYSIGGGSFTLDLNGCSITNAKGNTIGVYDASSTITFADSKETGKVIGGSAVYVYAGTVTFANGNYEGKESTVVIEDGAIVTIDKGTFNNTSEQNSAIENSGTLTINDGTFTNTKTGNQAGVYVVNNKGILTINGGSFSGAKYSAVAVDGNTTITGGTFSAGGDAHFGYYSGTLDLSQYNGTTALTDLTIWNEAGGEVTVDGNITLPDGYGLSEDGTTTVETLETGKYSVISTKVTITGVSIKVMNGENEVKPENNVYTITSDCTVTITVSGENLDKATDAYQIGHTAGLYLSVNASAWTVSADRKTATAELDASEFASSTTAHQIWYSTDGGTTKNDTRIYVLYQSAITSVEITWGAMAFVYDDEQDADGNEKGWTCENGANTVTVKNAGTTEIVPTVTYTSNDSFKDVITGTLTVDNNANWLKKGDYKVYTLTLSGKPTAALESTTIGTITVTITENQGQ